MGAWTSRSAESRYVGRKKGRVHGSAPLTADDCYCRGEAYFANSQIENALYYYDRAVGLGMDDGLLVNRRWTCLMLLGEFERAWQETDRTEAIRRAASDTTLHLPRHFRRVWNGSLLQERSVLVRCYHGLGFVPG